MSLSPSSMSLMGGPSGTSSAEPQAGIQYSRSSRPIAVPGPTPARVSKSCSEAISPSLAKYPLEMNSGSLGQGRQPPLASVGNRAQGATFYGQPATAVRAAVQ